MSNPSKSSPESPAKEPGPDFNTKANLHADTVAERFDAAKEQPGEQNYDDGDPARWPPFGPAAPDAAAMVKRLLDDMDHGLRIVYDNRKNERDFHAEKLLKTALIEKLGQGWIPVQPTCAGNICMTPRECAKHGCKQESRISECCCAIHHPNYGRCLQCPIHGTPPPPERP